MPIKIHPPFELKPEIMALHSIRLRWEELGKSPGQPIGDQVTIGKGYRQRYDLGGAIYCSDAGVAFVYGAIGGRYDELGGPLSWLGFPTSDEQLFAQGGRVSVFENGAIYWWPDVGAIEVNDVSVQYTGLVCFSEEDNDQLSGSDEPYVILGVSSPMGGWTKISQVYESVDSGEIVRDEIEIYRGKPYGMAFTGVLMEQDFGNPNEYKGEVDKAVVAATAGITAGITALSAGVAIAVAPLIAWAAPKITEAVNDALGTQDDKIGQWGIPISAKEMVVLAARSPDRDERGIRHKLASPLFVAFGANYKMYLSLSPA